MLPETPGFVAAMDAAGPWQPVGIALAMSEPNGPVEHDFFEELLATIERRLTAALPVDGVYVCAHGAAVTTEEDDPEGVLFELVRRIVGPDVPVVATFDLHANVSDRMVETIDAFIGYRTNPHLDMRERGAEAAAVLRDLLAGIEDRAGAGAPADRAADRDPADRRRPLCRDDRARPAAPAEIGPAIVNVSAMGGFAYCRHREKRPHSRRDRAPRRARDGGFAGPGDRALRLGQPRPVLSDADPARGGRRKGARGGARSVAAGAVLRRCRRQSRAAAGAATRCTCCAPSPRPGSRGRCSGSSTTRRSPPRRTATGCTIISTRISTATRRRISPSPGPRRRGSRRCPTAIASAGAASMPGCGWRWGRARRWRSAGSRSSSCRTGCNAPTRSSSR